MKAIREFAVGAWKENGWSLLWKVPAFFVAVSLYPVGYAAGFSVRVARFVWDATRDAYATGRGR